MPKMPVATDRLAVEKARVTYIYSFLACATLGVFGTLQIFVEGNEQLGYLELTGGLVILLAIAGLRLTRNERLIRNMVLLAILTMLLVMLATGGTELTGIFWSFMFPVSAFFLTNKREGVWWMVGLITLLVIFMVGSQFGWLYTPYTFITLRQLLISLVVVAIGIYVYQESRENLALETQKSDAANREEKIKGEIIIDNIDEGVVVVDTNGVVVLVSKPALDLLKWKEEDLLGKKFVEVIPMFTETGDKIADADRPLLKALRQHERARMRAVYVRKDGEKFPAEMTSRAIVVDGTLHGAVGTFRDISEENEIDRAKSEFVTLASHQLRTPISAIAWIGELLMHGDAGKLKPEQADYISQIYASNQRMLNLVDAMLTVSTLELGNLPVRPEKTDLAKISREILQQRLASLPAKKTLHIKEKYDPALSNVMFDQSIIKAILQHLTANAFKYTPEGGNVTVAIRAEGDNVIIEVGDNGMGIPTNQQEKIFTKLFRADNVKREDTDGTGLGLFIVKTMAEYVGGTIRFNSQENKGSTFTVTLPHNMPAKSGLQGGAHV